MYSTLTKEYKISFKNNLKQFCQQIIQQRIDAAKHAMEDAQKAANAEEKSSAGDKYETSRAMNHLEKDMYSKQLAEHIKELSALHSVDTNTIYVKATPGAFIHCSSVSFFLGAGLGKQLVDKVPVLFLSPKAPLAKMILGKKTGDRFSFNGTDILIKDIF